MRGFVYFFIFLRELGPLREEGHELAAAQNTLSSAAIGGDSLIRTGADRKAAAPGRQTPTTATLRWRHPGRDTWGST
ncbi:hypothetical protein JZ751_010597 [Albula glossodonta]|uniref:Uncharacterized protein n=1 Tax=Albula glossodonta TaxID=121402 RepID=A0A8T2N7E1_9TELE|nr:hypothetical protein JZ751_010597 [Albula glossodonta]